MPAPEKYTDAHGFPVPSQFDDVDPKIRHGHGAYHRRIRWLVSLVLIAVVLTLLYRSKLADVGRKAMGDFYINRAQAMEAMEDYSGAIDEVDRALSWHGDEPRWYAYRAGLHSAANDLNAAEADYSRAIEQLGQEGPRLRTHLLQQRSMIYQRQNKATEAIEDLNRALELQPNDPVMLNARAYACSVLNVEAEKGLEDIEKAFQLEGNPQNAAFLDTRGYIYYRLGKYSEAMRDIEAAIKITEQSHQKIVEQLPATRLQPRDQKRILRRAQQDLAVMIHHRGEILEKLGDKSAAEADLQRAEELGFSIENGVF